MSRWAKRMKKYERQVLLGLVILLLVSFSVTGAIECGQRAGHEAIDWGGDFLVAPNQRESVDSDELGSVWDRYRRVLGTLRSPSLSLLPALFLRGDWLYDIPGTWAHVLAVEAARHRGYQCPPERLQTAVREAVARAIHPLEVNDATYGEFLSQRFRSPSEFQETIGEMVLKDAFLTPLIETHRYAVSYPEAYETWKGLLQRVNLGYVALQAEDFSSEALRREQSRARIGRQADLLARLSRTAKTLQGLATRVEAWRSGHDGTLPGSLADLGPAPDGAPPRDAWEHEIRYSAGGEGFALRSAGPDGAYDSSDDVTLETVRQLEARGRLRELANLVLAVHDRESAWPETLAAAQPAGGDPDEVGSDPWGRPWIYVGEAQGPPRLSSAGPDGEAGGPDDVIASFLAGEGEEPVAVVPLGSGLVAFLLTRDDEDLDAWQRRLRIDLADPSAWGWTVASAGADGRFGTDDDLKSGNEAELRRIYQESRAEFVEPQKRRLAALYVHLPLVPDEALRRLLAAHPELKPDERKAYNRWRSLHQDTAYLAEDPSDPIAGEGAGLAARVAPGHTPNLVPDAAIFGDAPEGMATGDPDFSTYVERGWRPILLRELLVDGVLREALTQLVRNREAIAEWEKQKAAVATWEAAQAAFEAAEGEDPGERPAAPGERPAELALEEARDRWFGEALPGDEDPPWIGVYRGEKPLTQDEWQALPDIGDYNLTLHTQRLKGEGELATVVLVLNEMHTRAIVQNLQYEAERQQDFEEVYGTLFDRLILQTRMELARKTLDDLRRSASDKTRARPAGAPEDEGAEGAPVDPWPAALEAWAAELGDIPYSAGETGFFVGARPPRSAAPDPEALTEDEMRRRMQLDYVRQTGFSAIEGARRDRAEFEPGTLATTVMTDPEPGTDAAYLFRLVAVKDPPPAAFSPRDYRDYLFSEVFGGPKGGRGLGGAAGVREQEKGRLMQALRDFYSNWTWIRDTFDLRTTDEVEKRLEDRRR